MVIGVRIGALLMGRPCQFLGEVFQAAAAAKRQSIFIQPRRSPPA
jgi:hypothetical protein